LLEKKYKDVEEEFERRKKPYLRGLRNHIRTETGEP